MWAAEAYSPETFVYGVDTWEGDEQAGYYKKVYVEVANHQEVNHRKRCRLIRSTFDEASNYFEDKSAVSHMGLHTYDAVKHDYDVWVKKVKDGGTILFHDCNVRKMLWGVEVMERLKEDESVSTVELQNGHGLGIATLSFEKPDWHAQIGYYFDLLTTKGHLLSEMDRINTRYLCIKEENLMKHGNQSLKNHIDNLEEVILEQERYIKTRMAYRLKRIKIIVKTIMLRRADGRKYRIKSSYIREA